MGYADPPTFTIDPDWFIPDTDYAVIRDLAGVDASAWPDARIQEPSFLPAALAEAKARVPVSWESDIDQAGRNYLRLAIQSYTAALMVPAATPALTADFKIGSFALKSADTQLLASEADLFGRAAEYFARIVLPTGTVVDTGADCFARPMVRTGSVIGVGSGRLW